MKLSLKPSLLVPLALLAAAVSMTAPAEGADLSIQKIAPYKEGLTVPDAIRTQCKIDEKIPAWIEAAAKRKFNVTMVDDASAVKTGDSVAAKIVGITGIGGGAFSGAKYITIEVTYWSNGQVKGTLTASRFTTGGAFAIFKGTCSMLGRCAKVLGSDVGKWLNNPTMNAKSGN